MQFDCATVFDKNLSVHISGGSGAVSVEVNGVVVNSALAVTTGDNSLGRVTLHPWPQSNYVAIETASFQATTAVDSVTLS